MSSCLWGIDKHFANSHRHRNPGSNDLIDDGHRIAQAGLAAVVGIHLVDHRNPVVASTFVQVVDFDRVRVQDQVDQAVAVAVADRTRDLEGVKVTSCPEDDIAEGVVAAVGTDVGIDIACSVDDRVDVDLSVDVRAVY